MATKELFIRIGANADQAKREFRDIQKGIDVLNQRFGAIAKVGGAAFLGLGAAAGVAIKEFAGFEQQMSKVLALTGATDSEFAELNKTARDLGATTQFSAREAAEGMEFLALAGFETNEIIGTMPGLLNLAAAGMLDLGKASDLVTDIMSQFGLEVEDANSVSDLFAKTQAKSNTSVEQLGAALLNAGGSAKNLGITIEETSGALGVLADQGLKGEAAGTALNNLLLNLTANSDQLKELGVNVFDAQGNFAGLENIITDYQGALVGANDEQANNIKTLGIGKIGQQALNRLLNEGAEGYRELTNTISDNNGFAERSAKTINDNVVGSLKTLNSALSEAKIGIGEQLAPAFRSLVDLGTSILTKFNQLDESTKSTIATFIKWGLVITGLLTALGAVGLAVLAVGKGLTALGVSARFAAVGFRLLLGATGIGLLLIILPKAIQFARDFSVKLEEWKNKFPAIAGAINVVLAPLKLLLFAIDKVIGAGKRLFEFFGKSQPTGEVDKLKDKLEELNKIADEGGSKAAEATKKQREELEKQIAAIEANTDAMNKLKDAGAERKEVSANIEEMTNKIKENEEALKSATEAEREFLEAANAGLAANIDQLKERKKELGAQITGEEAGEQDLTAVQDAADKEVEIEKGKQVALKKERDAATQSKIDDLKSEIELIQAERQGLSDSEIDFLRQQSAIEKGFREAKNIEDEEQRALELEKLQLQQENLLAIREEAEARKREREAELTEESRALLEELDAEEQEKLIEQLQTKEDIENDFKKRKVQQEIDFRKQAQTANNTFGLQSLALDKFIAQQKLGIAANLATNLLSTLATENEKAFKLQKGLNIAQAIMSTFAGANKALDTLPPPASFVTAGLTIATGLANVSKIQSQKFVKAQTGGTFQGGIPGQDSIPALVTPGETLIPAPIARSFRDEFPDFRDAFRNATETGRSLAEGEPAGTQNVEVTIGLKSEASQFITAEQFKNQQLGIDRSS